LSREEPVGHDAEARLKTAAAPKRRSFPLAHHRARTICFFQPMQRSYLDESLPIVALATPLGESAISLIRASGPGAIELAASCFSRPAALLAAPGHTLVHGALVDPSAKDIVDEVLVSVFRAPRSATGEDGVEFSCHGSPAVIRRALAVLEAAGFAPALPGEYSFRAFLHGKTDLARAEAVQELVRAGSDGARAEALRRLEGGLSRRVGAARALLVELLADVQARLDYGEDEAEAENGFDSGPLRLLRENIASLIESYAAGRLHGEGARVVVAGRPNAGKSSLFNLLLREERAIVGPEPGTTRDWIEARIEIEGMYIRLIDTAGIRDGAGEIEAEGVARSRRLSGEAESVLYVVDGIAGLHVDDEVFFRSRPDAIRIWNKIDSAHCLPAPKGFVSLSAASGAGLALLLSSIVNQLKEDFGGGISSSSGSERGVLVASARQKSLLDAALAAIDSCLSEESSGAPLDVMALDLRGAADALGEITGEIASAEVFEAVFSRFCVGK
jgi:tRNA modification GTPase